jgi:hypothetical protein
MGIVEQRLASFGERQSAIGSLKESDAQMILKQIDLLNESSWSQVGDFSCAVETPSIGNSEECFEVRIVHRSG